MKNPNNADEIKKLKKVFCSIEREYGKPYAHYLTRWNIWRDKAFERIKSIQKFEIKHDLEVNYEQMPKYK